MQYPKIEWEDFQDGSGAKTELTVRMLIGNAYGCDECYNKQYFAVSVGKKNREKYFRVYINNTLYAETKYEALEGVKGYALECLAEHIGGTWLFQVISKAEQTSTKSAVL